MNVPVNTPSTREAKLVDKHGRVVTYLRLAITDRCNLRCKYCMPEKGVDVLPHDKILSYEELERLSRIFVSLGVDKIRITGGEPFVRKGCFEFMERLKAQNPGLDLRLTSNGVALLPYLADLKRIGIDGINLSIDTLDPVRFYEFTRRDKLTTVLNVFHEAIRLGIRVKVNSVVQLDTSDQELVKMADLIKENPISLRFIEQMPFSGNEQHQDLAGAEKLETRLFKLFPGLSEISSNDVETARKFAVPGYKGTLGIIEGESRKFCSTCNKVRITPAGMLKNCLYDSGVLNLIELLRSGLDDEEIRRKVIDAVASKLIDGHKASECRQKKCEDSMATIGG